MGKSKNASFSSVDKSNFQLFKEKFKEKSVNQKIKNDKNDRNYESEKKKKKNFWSKWLTSARGSWSCGETLSPQVKSQIVATKSLERSMDVFEIPIDPERKISKIFIEPTEKGLKSAIAEYCGPSSCPEELFPNKRPPFLRDVPYEIRAVENDDTKMNQEKPLKTYSKSLAKNTALPNDKKEPPQKIEPLLTSALFIHKDIDRMVESAVFMEPNLPRDYAESKPSDEISQKSLKINNVRVSYKGKGNDQIIKTVKTTSEPTWEERKKIIHRQRLKENINYLVKQFVFLEAQDVIDSSRLENNSSAGKKGIQFNRSSGSASRDLSREVSPEILVNIKPFKEYVSENIVSSRRSVESPKFAERQDRALKIGPVGASENVEIDKVTEKRTCPVLKSTVTFLKKNDSVHNEENTFGVKESILTLSPVKDDMSTTWNKGASENLDLEPPSLSFWDVYKTYSTCKNLLQVEVELENTSFQFQQKKREEKMQADAEAEEEVLRNSKSLDEVLDTLEDGDHDLIFQKNMAQFKKKISVMPRLDFRKPTFSTNKRGLAKLEDKAWRKLIRVENPLETEKPLVEKVAKVVGFSLENSREKKIERFRSECLALRKELLWESEKILGNIYLTLCESVVINQVLAIRVEAKVFSLCQTLREVYDMQEKNTFVVLRIENPKNFDEISEKVQLLSETPSLLNKSCLIDPKESETIAMFLYVNKHDLHRNIASLPDGIIETDRRASSKVQLFPETVERFPEFPEIPHECQLHLNKLSFKETLSRKFSELSKEIKTDEEGKNEAKKLEVSMREKSTQTLTRTEAGYETSRRIVLILNDPSYEYTVRIYDNKFGSLYICSKSHSEPDVFRSLANERRHRSDSSMTSPKREMAKPGTQEIASGCPRSKNYSDVCVDDFHVLYSNSKESLNDGEEETTSFHQCLRESQSTQLNAVNEKAKKLEEGEKIQESKKRMLQETDVSIRSGRTLKKYKSNTSPTEIAVQNQSSLEKRRTRRSHVSLKEVEKQYPDLVHRRKKITSADEAEETRRTESASLNSKAPTPMYEDISVRETPDFEKSLAIPKPLMLKQEGEADKRKMFLLKKSGTNVKKEVVAAINLIKDLNPCKGEAKGRSKQISLVILLSRN